ncbi:MAG: TIGR02757 family protein [Bacteroidia bacterium]|nr:TIGR02757 family protein [Bacteroidia bacterium]
MIPEELKNFLDEKYNQFNCTSFIESDPISIPRRFSRKEDIEIAAFLSATIAWGQRPTIIRNANQLMQLMDGEPYEFLTQTAIEDPERFDSFVHRTFNGIDCLYFMRALSSIYRKYGGLEKLFSDGFAIDGTVKTAIIHFREQFLSFDPQHRTEKHIANPAKGSSAKRINMLLRWMVRPSVCGVDFGLWNSIPVSALMMPLDVHSGSVARKLGLLRRTQNDWQAVEELTTTLRLFDPSDPVKYDFALFGLGAFEKF